MKKLLPDQKREYLRVLLTEGKAAASNYLEKLDCKGGVFIYKSEAESRNLVHNSILFGLVYDFLHRVF